mmetsp:Transcript_72283/g.209257  ORF Transcript_72283/g.209257 Transcript_72283/m.209257 type:complete len:100 (+) Transcript_72283:1-300(+)
MRSETCAQHRRLAKPPTPWRGGRSPRPQPRRDWRRVLLRRRPWRPSAHRPGFSARDRDCADAAVIEPLEVAKEAPEAEAAVVAEDDAEERDLTPACFSE